jgi:hypothetical protein
VTRRVLLLGCAAALTAACTGPSASGQADPTAGPTAGPTASSTVPNQLPDDVEAVTDPPRPSATDVVLSFVGWDEASGSVQAGGYVSPIVEDGGTCTLELTRDDRVVTGAGPGAADATTTICGGLSVPGAELSAGEWTVVLRYESSGTSGTSEARTVEVPG